MTAPRVRLGLREDEGVAPSVFAMLERGVSRRPDVAAATRGLVELRFDEGYDPVRIEFGPDGVLVEDGPAAAPDLVVSGRLPHLVGMTTLRLRAGVPTPVDRSGRLALRRLLRGEIRISGRRRLAWRLIALLGA